MVTNEANRKSHRAEGAESRRLRRAAIALIAGAVLGGNLAAIAHGFGGFQAVPGHHAPGASAAASRSGPPLVSPVDDAIVDGVPAFSWEARKGAAKYEFQLAADRDFGSIVLGQGRGSYQTRNTFATIDETLPNGTYFWRVRAIDKDDDAGPWSSIRSWTKAWTTRPGLIGPVSGASVTYPGVPLVLRWSTVPRAYKYLVEIAADPSLATLVVKAPGGGPVETSGTVLAPPVTLPPGRYYWAVTPEDSEKHKGARSAVGSFEWSWPTDTATRVSDLDPDSRVFDPQLSWDQVAGAARYEVEISSSQDFALGSKVCCSQLSIGSSYSPTKVLPNNHYYWRVRALDLDGNAGRWNIGPDFEKSFDSIAPPDETIPNLHLRDNVSDSLPAGSTTTAPVVAWDPVPGAASYEVDVVPYVLGGCNWTSSSSDTWHEVKTASTAWTPLGTSWNGQVPGGVSYPSASTDGSKVLISGKSYCVRLLARSDRDFQGHEVVSDWTQLGGVGNPAFTYQAPPSSSPSPGLLTTPAANYGAPAVGITTNRAPLFTWTPVSGAASYFVVVSRDAAFTDIVDVAFTQQTAYAPRAGSNPKTYPDETTSYYWAVMPAKDANGGNVNSLPFQNNPRSFQKRSIPPALLSPGSGADISSQPTFRWTPAEGAREYRLQVAQDPTFGDPIDDITTDATSYTTLSTYPADTALYWRVRANDENRIGLSWSATGTFRRRLPTPAMGQNPGAGDTIPVLSWSPVQGATSYDMHVDQADGTTRDFTMRSTAFTPTTFYGTGIWRWQVRARFPKSLSGETAGPYSPLQSYARRIDAPSGARDVNAPRHMLLSWDPSVMVKEYRVQVSASSSFSSTIESRKTENTSYAPKLVESDYLKGGTLYWRVAAVDEGGNVGAWAARVLGLPQRLNVSVSAVLSGRRGGYALVKVTNPRRHPVRGARVSVSGARTHPRAKRTRRNGLVKFKLRTRGKGRIVFRARKRGFQSGRAVVRVR